jgi:2-dehydropantoate 2-reductase
VIGAGAIGGLVGARLALAGESVTFMVRGANLEAIRSRGIRLIAPDGSEQVADGVAGTDDYAAAGRQDLVVLATKAHQLEAIAASLAALIGPETVIVPMQNGIPYWYFHRHGGEYEGRAVLSVDSRGRLAESIPPARVLGCVVYPASELVAPGVVKHVEGERFPLGELDGSLSERARRIATAFERAGFKAPLLSNIRAEIWLKLWGTLSFNPISALSHATLEGICRDPDGRAVVEAMMREAQAVAGKLGVVFKISIDKRIAGAEAVGAHKTSMLQDVEQGRPLELEALVGSVVELGRITGVATPSIEAVHHLAALLSRTLAARGTGLALAGD